MALDFSLNCNSNLATGKVNCEGEIKEIDRYILTKPRWSADVLTDTIDDEYIAERIACFDWIPLRAHQGIESIDKEPSYGETTRGTDQFVRGSIYGSILEWTPWNPCYANELGKISGAYNLLMVDIDGKLYGSLKGNTFKGFELHDVRFHSVRANNGTDYSNARLRMQCSPKGSREMENNIIVLNSSVDFAGINGVIHTKLVVETAEANNLVVSVYEGCGGTERVVFGENEYFFVVDSTGAILDVKFEKQPDGTYLNDELAAGDYTIQIAEAEKGVCAFLDASGQAYISDVVPFTLA